jgi:NAD(P)-dependent dehydrogenase (short-subunit alcohol dehydrogenase family)
MIVQKLKSSGHRIVTFSRSAENPLSNIHHSVDLVTDSINTIQAPDQIHGVVYAPGSIHLKPFRGLKPDDFLQDLNINFLGMVKLLQWAQKGLQSEGNSSVVLFSTVAVSQGMPYHTSVAASKGAVEGFTRSLAAEWAPSTRVNCIAPSLTDTPLASKLLNTDAKKESAAGRHPLKRYGQAGDIASAALFLLSDESSWITGQVLPVDGGMSSIRL